MLSILKNIYNELVRRGIPNLIFQDPSTKKPSITYTAVRTSLIICLLSLSKFTSDLLGGLSFSDSLSLFVASSLLYLGRNLQKSGNNFTSEVKEKEEDASKNT